MSLLTTLSLPRFILASPYLSPLLPITLGTLIGFSVNRLSSTKTVYATLRQPPYRPPSWVFAPVWTTLYGAMGYAAYRVSASAPDKLSGLYTVQLGLNFLWMPLFFWKKLCAAAMVDILGLIGCVGALTKWYAEVDTVAAAVMVPYLMWLGFAAYLTAGVGVLNGWDIKGAAEKGKKV
ncbi:benzodiazepine receptor family protein [Wilcoxina mikolae CBS 423.85]|nr:benzodiazepine receptor family protein [Wilcoxina mikolae CBS 423.85]